MSREDAIRRFREWLSEPLDLGFPDEPNSPFVTAAEERDGDFTEE